MLANLLLAAALLQSGTDAGHRTPTGLWYEVTGSGPTVVLLHGSNLDSRSWGGLPQALAGRYRVVRTDLRSHGQSRDASGPFSWSDDVIELLDAVRANRAVLVGHSLGAQIAIDVALRHPTRVNGLVLIGPGIGGLPLTKPIAGFESLVTALRQGDFVEAGKALGRMPVMTLYRDTTRQSEVRRIVADNVRLFRADRKWIIALEPPAIGRLSELAIPTLVLTGAADPTESNAAAAVLIERVRGAVGETFPVCGHLVPLDCDPETVRAIGDFLGRSLRGADDNRGSTRSGSAPRAQAPAPLPALDSARMIADLARLAHDSMGGRGVMTPENARARAWLATEFRRIGLTPVGSDFVHPFTSARASRPDSIRGANVLGVVRGTRSPERVIVVSAHYDHVGTRNGQIYNGADDNASGTAAVLAMAAHFKAHPPANTMLFALWDAEEAGLAGARAFVAAPPVPLSSIAANVNLDMVSRNDKDELYASGATLYPAMRPILEALVPEAAVTLKLGHDSGGGKDDWTSQSDHAAFHAARIPFVYFGVEDHADYHQPTDDIERIQPGFYVRAVRTIAGFVDRLDRAQAVRP